MDKTSKIFLTFLIVFGLQTFGQKDEQFVDKSFLIIASTKDLADAFKIAKTAAQKTGIMFRDNKLQIDKIDGVTFPADTCKRAGFDFPCYVARGRYDDGNYLSVEYSNRYEGFQKGLFIVIAASGYKDDKELKQTLKKVRQTYPESYIKRTNVYIGCIH